MLEDIAKKIENATKENYFIVFLETYEQIKELNIEEQNKINELLLNKRKELLRMG